MTGKLQAKSIQDYGLFDKGKEIYSFTVTDPKKRKKLDLLQGKLVTKADLDLIVDSSV